MFDQALQGVKVIDLTHYITGPYCTKLLADYGADVLKIEKSGEGDGARKMGPFLHDEPHPEKSGVFAYLNTNKRGITLNLKAETGKEIFRKLVAGADILVENFSPGVMARLELGYESLKNINPRLVMISISNFGQAGPYRDFKGSELVLEAMGSEMHARGITTREPTKLGGNAVLMQTGNMGAAAAVIHYWGARRTGHGDHIDLGIFETQISSIDERMSAIIGYQYSGRPAVRMNPGGSGNFPDGVYACADGYFHITGGWSWFDRIMKMLDYPEELKDYPEMATPQGQQNPELREIFNALWLPWCFDHTKAEIFAKAREAGVPLGPLNTMEDILNDAHFIGRKFFIDVDHPVMGTVRMPGEPFKMTDSPSILRMPAPLLGQHNEEVLGELGFSKADMVVLKESGVI